MTLGDEVAERLEEAGRHDELAVLARHSGDVLAGRDHLGVVNLSDFADSVAEVTRAKHEAVEAGHGGDLLHLGQRLGRLDLENDDPFLVGVAEVLGDGDKAVLAVGVAAVERALAD
jgi:hypothetical protein